MAMAGCMPGQGEGASPSATGEGCAREVSGPRGASARFSPGAIRYAVPVMAPDACHKAGPDSAQRREGDRLIVTHALERTPGICAQVMTRVVFEGALRGVDPPPRALVVEILSTSGDVVERVDFDRPADCR
ncbi:MAG: hypothetical protein CML46_05245 [Rhodobacteraceae bacterium]|nr:hypothetical protein [Paracoccaceae bacterium]